VIKNNIFRKGIMARISDNLMAVEEMLNGLLALKERVIMVA